jgi:hypothetical protein
MTVNRYPAGACIYNTAEVDKIMWLVMSGEVVLCNSAVQPANTVEEVIVKE